MSHHYGKQIVKSSEQYKAIEHRIDKITEARKKIMEDIK